MRSLTRLQPGMKIMLGNQKCVVLRVSDSRAVIQPMGGRVVTIKPRFSESVVQFQRRADPISISPNSDVPIIA